VTVVAGRTAGGLGELRVVTHSVLWNRNRNCNFFPLANRNRNTVRTESGYETGFLSGSNIKRKKKKSKYYKWHSQCCF
jgi:hypothetical protein